MTTREGIVREIASYTTSFQEEAPFKIAFQELLAHPRCFHRDHLPGHITGSSWIVNRDLTKTLLVLHAKLNRWLQPGGHADGDENIVRVAIREAEEETGVKNLHLSSSSIFDLDIHPIPLRSDFPEHLHYDVRLLFMADEREPLRISDESHDLRWVDLTALTTLTQNNPSVMRMAEKTGKLAISS